MDVQRHLFLRRCFAYICCLLLCFITATTVYAQKVSVKGTVVDTNGDAIIGASVKVLKKSSVGTITDLDGNFTLSVPEDATKLEISFVGMKSVVATVKPGKHLKVVLEEDNQTLDEVVVVGYGTSRRGDLTGAISSVSEKVLKDIPITSAAARLLGCRVRENDCASGRSRVYGRASRARHQDCRRHQYACGYSDGKAHASRPFRAH